MPALVSIARLQRAQVTETLKHTAGAYGLPKLPVSTGFKLYDNFDEEYIFEYPRGWVARSNHQRKGIYFADFNVSATDHCYSQPAASLKHRAKIKGMKADG